MICYVNWHNTVGLTLLETVLGCDLTLSSSVRLRMRVRLARLRALETVGVPGISTGTRLCGIPGCTLIAICYHNNNIYIHGKTVQGCLHISKVLRLIY